jgi:hypothetical protein
VGGEIMEKPPGLRHFYPAPGAAMLSVRLIGARICPGGSKCRGELSGLFNAGKID